MTTILLVVIFSKDLALGTAVGITELGVKTVIYYLHERAWNLTSLGRKKEM